jgi:hypothetical protein
LQLSDREKIALQFTNMRLKSIKQSDKSKRCGKRDPQRKRSPSTAADLLGGLRTRQEDREGNRRRAFMRRQGKLWPPIKPVTKRTLARKRLARRDPK